MTVKELLNELQKMPPDLEIIIQGDDEGNSFHASYGVDVAVDDLSNGYPPIMDMKNHYDDENDIPNGRVVVIV